MNIYNTQECTILNNIGISSIITFVTFVGYNSIVYYLEKRKNEPNGLNTLFSMLTSSMIALGFFTVNLLIIFVMGALSLQCQYKYALALLWVIGVISATMHHKNNNRADKN